MLCLNITEILCIYHTDKPIKNVCVLDAISKQQNSNLFNTFDHDIKSDISSDDDCYKLLIGKSF